MEISRTLYDSIAPPEYKLQKAAVHGTLILAGNLRMRYRLLSLPKLSERDTWVCRIAGRVCCDGETKFIEELLEFDGPFAIHYAAIVCTLKTWSFNP